ncbi:bifunctional glycosyltransferase family 2/GtrA family protein [Loigolactobacillus bifermentans]|uniref:Glycosyltransferase-like protein n=1 Tax=Loigolactobacillus bifermentans DSM 20003 TaxID=1423726 RepID=A0A0R1GN24_9LACO|nr:bifunctional glycosyltransferase family 2/GtrA family protein [Loigolactobacillus bifermentans]KRK35438.1 glycosyltransferase-like protein [Loigolactobacillus bifermentans DSM 20003]QGG60424.1 glycosyltransferase [Loigolactobacillus bifermentans]
MSNIDKRIGILIPALEPDQRLIQLLNDLISTEFMGNILVVDDGTVDQTIFEQIKQKFVNAVTVIHHPQNLGKGAALKTGFRYFENKLPDCLGIATLDSDGQHTLSDLQKCVALFATHPDALILGSRQFSKAIPFRSRFGNVLTHNLVRLLTGLRISDTQTGLRVIPMSYAQKALSFGGDRFEFEFTMLLQAKANSVLIVEQPIETIYLDGNVSSHFRVIRDSVAIYLRFFKFALSGLVSFVIDNSLFALFIHLSHAMTLTEVMMATVAARLLSAVANYSLNHHMVFDGQGERTLVKYGAIMVVQMSLSGLLTGLMGSAVDLVGHQTLGLTIIKMVIDFLLFLVSYQVQKRLIFVEAHPNGHVE